MYYDDYDYRDSSFEQAYSCYSISFLKKPHLDKGDKIIMPPSALDRLASMRIDYPMLFQLQNPSSGRISHCGVLEFTADEGLVFLPSWMMENMGLQEGDIMEVRNTNLLKGTYVKLQPHTNDFLDISNPKVILEKTLRSFSCLTIGDTIMVPFNNKEFYIDIVETKPSFGISIIETDCEVDFATPLDYKEPEKPAPSSLSNKAPAEVQDELAKEEPKFTPFTGVARRLDGKPLNQSAKPVSSPMLKHHQSQSEANNGTNRFTSASVTSRQRAGKVVFGSNASQDPITAPKVAAKATSTEPPKEEPKFQAFTGKKYSLRD